MKGDVMTAFQHCINPDCGHTFDLLEVHHRCPDCGAMHTIFGESHLDQVAQELGVPVLARLPIDPELAASVDTGKVEYIERNYLDEVAAQLDR